MLLSSPPSGDGRTWRLRVFVFLRRERLLSRRPSALGIVSGRLSGYQTTLHHRWIGPWVRLLLGITKEDSPSGIHRTHGFPSQRADGQAQNHPEISFNL